MESSKQIFAAIVAAGVLSAGTAAFAQPGPGGCDPQGRPGMMRGGMQGMQGMMGEPGARAEQHLTRLKTELKLTPQQEPLWQAFAEKAKAEAGQGMKAMRDQAQNANLTAPERMDRKVALMKERAVAMESVNDSFKRLYESLTAEQKKIADQQAGRFGHMGPRGGTGGPRGSQGPQGPQGPQGTNG